MREHEVPTHVQAEDKALLWFTFPQDRGSGGHLRRGLRRLPLLSLRPLGAEAGHRRLDGHHRHRHDRGQGGRPGVAPGGRRPAQVQPGGPALRRVPVGAGNQRTAASARGETRPPAAAGEEGGGQPGPGGEGGETPGPPSLPPPQLVRQGTPFPKRRRQSPPDSDRRPQERQEALGPLPGDGRLGPAGGGPAAQQRPGRRPGRQPLRRRLAAGRNLL